MYGLIFSSAKVQKKSELELCADFNCKVGCAEAAQHFLPEGGIFDYQTGFGVDDGSDSGIFHHYYSLVAVGSAPVAVHPDEFQNIRHACAELHLRLPPQRRGSVREEHRRLHIRDDADQDITRGTTALFIENNYANTSGAISLFYSWGDHWINDGYRGTKPLPYRFISYDEMLGSSVWQSINLFEGNRLTVGMDYYRYGGKATKSYIEGPKTGFDSLYVDKREDELAGYIEMRQDLGSLFTLNAGIRADHHFTLGTELVPQFGAAIHLPANAEVKLSVAKGFRYPILREMFMFPPQNTELRPESLWNYELAFSQSLFNSRLNYGINIFHLEVENLIQTIRTPNGPKNQNSDGLKNTGVEVQASYLITKNIAVNGNYSFLKMENPVVGIPAHKAYLGGSFSKNSWHASTGLQYINSLYTTPKSTQPPTVLANEQTDNFLLWNARVSYQLSDMIQLWVNGDNLLNTKYQINDGYPMPGIAFMGGVNLRF